MTVDLRQTIAPKSDQLNADDLIAGPRTITITAVKADPSTPEQPILIHFEGDNGKPYKPCKSMRRGLVQMCGADASTFTGRSMTLYRDADVQFGGMKVGGIRISHMSHVERPVTMALTASKAARKPFTVQPLKAAPAPRQEPIGAPGMTSASADDLAMAAADRGTDHFRAWWNSAEGKDARAVLTVAMDVLRARATAADKARDDDPFGLPPLDGPSAEDMARAEQEALAAAKAAEGAAA